MTVKLPSPREVKSRFPLSQTGSDFIESCRSSCKKLIDRKEKRLLIVVGPCSIHSKEEGLSYGRLLQPLIQEMEGRALIVMRACLEKPRTTLGWRGLALDPNLNGTTDILHGIEVSRSLLIGLTELRIPLAMEFLTPSLSSYFSDLITWGWIGARTSSSQPHRLLASQLPLPIGFKNSVDGNVDAAIDGVEVARHSHTFPEIGEEGFLSSLTSKGNPHTHVILRGSSSGPNYSEPHIRDLFAKLRKAELPPRVMIDCSHGNSLRGYFAQKEVFQEVIRLCNEGCEQIIGLMVESHLEAGRQAIPSSLSALQKGVSITDPCLDFTSAAELLRSALSSSTVMSLT